MNRTAVALSMLLTLILLSLPVWAQRTMTAPDVNGLPGTHVMIPITISDGTNVSAVQFTLEFDNSLLSIPDRGVLPGDLMVDHSIGPKIEPGKLKVVIFSSSLKSLKGGNGAVIQVKALVNANATFGESSPLTMKDVVLVDSQGNGIGGTPDSGTMSVSILVNEPGTKQNELVFPQVANGSVFKTSVVLVNKTDAPSSGQLHFEKSGGSPFEMKLVGLNAPTSTVDFTVPPAGSVVIESDGTGDLNVGYAYLNSTGPLGGTILFQILSGGQVVTEAGVEPSPVTRWCKIPVIFQAGKVNTGVALLNRTGSSNIVELVLKNSSGNIIATKTETLGAHEHRPKFVNQFFTIGEPSFSGSLEVTAGGDFSAVALKQTGVVLTTFPVATSPE